MNKTKIIAGASVLALLLSVVALVVGLTRGSSTPVSTDSLGGTGSISGGSYNAPVDFRKGAALGAGEVQSAFAGNMPVGTNLVQFQNKGLGRTIYLNPAVATLSNNYATTSFKLYAFATTTQFVASSTLNALYFATTPVANASTTMSINGALIATGTTPYTSITSDDTNTASSTVAVPDGGYFYFLLSNPFPFACPVATCDSATSSTRGFSLHVYVPYHYQP